MSCKTQNHNSSKVIIFLHIPKTAGTTLHRIIERQYKAEEVFAIDGQEVQASTRIFQTLSDADRQTIRVLQGHMKFGLDRYFAQPSTYITILRHPLERVVSHFCYVLRNRQHYAHETLKTLNITTPGEYVHCKVTPETDNGQTRLISGLGCRPGVGDCSSEMLEKAKQNLKQFFSLVGISEQFDETLVLATRQFGWRSPFYTKQNVTRHRLQLSDLSHQDLAAIEACNQFDLELYEYAKGLFQEAIAQYGSSFQTDLIRFKALNQVAQLTQKGYRISQRLLHPV